VHIVAVAPEIRLPAEAEILTIGVRTLEFSRGENVAGNYFGFRI
jgi:hypothetical protein